MEIRRSISLSRREGRTAKAVRHTALAAVSEASVHAAHAAAVSGKSGRAGLRRSRSGRTRCFIPAGDGGNVFPLLRRLGGIRLRGTRPRKIRPGGNGTGGFLRRSRTVRRPRCAHRFAVHTYPNAWELNPRDRNYYYYLADQLQAFFPGMENYLYEAHAWQLRYHRELRFTRCENCGSHILQQDYAPVNSNLCDVCRMLDELHYIDHGEAENHEHQA